MYKQEHLLHLATAANVLWKLIKERGYDPDLLFRKAGIAPELLNKPEARVSCAKMNHLWEDAIRLTCDPCLAIDAGKHWHPSYLHALGYAWLAGKNLADSLERFSRYSRIISDSTEIRLSKEYGEFTIGVHNHPDGPHHPARRIATLSVMIEMCRLNAGSDLNPTKVCFKNTYPGCLEKFRKNFRCDVIFDTGQDSMTLKSIDVYRELPSANKHLAEINDQIIVNYLEKLDRKSIKDQVKSQILKVLSSGKVTDDRIAKNLSLSVRSLQRKLRQEGSTFRSLLDNTRMELSQKYIKDPDTRLEELAFLTGFSEYSSFSRAFKRWTGSSPSEYRTNQLPV